MAAYRTVDQYVKALARSQAALVTELRKLIKAAAPGATESIKWSQPVYEENGPFVWIKAATAHVSLGFWRGVELPDPKGLLQGTGDRMRHVKLATVADIQKKALTDLVKTAVKLNHERGNPTYGR